jgi:ribosome maturation factor RimP
LRVWQASKRQSIPQTCEDWAATKATYDCGITLGLKAEAIHMGHHTSSSQRQAQQKVMLAIQDTTDLDLSQQAHKQGMGYLEQVQMLGVKVHSVLEVSAAGVPRGLRHQQVWATNRQQVVSRHQRRQRDIADTESQRWLRAQQATAKALEANVSILSFPQSFRSCG